MQESQEVATIVQEFVKYLGTVEAKNHISYLEEEEPRETKEVLEKPTFLIQRGKICFLKPCGAPFALIFRTTFILH